MTMPSSPHSPPDDPSLPGFPARLHITVKGRVQGVGFRAHVEYAARELGLTGWVRNVGFDVVEAVAEGHRPKLERLADVVRTGPRASQVDEASVEWQEPTGEFTYFIVRRSV
jgi:acylphosphatase